MSIKVPRSFKLNNYKYTAAIVPQSVIDERLITLGPPGTFGGFCDNNTLSIGVSGELNLQEIPRVYLHEVLHACFKADRNFNREDEEKIVELLEERLTDLIKNNPKLISYLQENL